MDKCIDIKVKGSFLRKSSSLAGVQGEGNATIMHITFDDSWAGLAKSVTFWNSRGENPVKRTLTSDLLTDMAQSLLVYDVPIPPEPMEYDGELSFVIDGYNDGKRQRSVEDTLTVEPAGMAEDAAEPTDPTPSQAEQLQSEIEAILPAVQEESIKAQEAAQEAEESAVAADVAAGAAFNYSVSAGQAARTAQEAEAAAAASRQATEEAKEAAEKAAKEAQAAAGGDFASKVYVDNTVGSHNTGTDTHSDIRLLIAGLTERLNALANSDDTTLDQMAEVVAYIKDNRDLIEQITTGKVSVSDIVDNLTTDVADKPLSAAQGVALKALAEAAVANAAALSDVRGYNNAQTVFNADGSITETFADGVQVTTFNEDGTIVTAFTGTDGSTMTKTVTFNADGSITEVVE